MAKKEVDLQKVADGLGITLDELLAQGLTKAVSEAKQAIEQEIEDKKAESNKRLYDTGKTFIPKLKETLNDDNEIIVCECRTSKKAPTVQLVGYIKETKELVVYLNDKLSSVPESYLITSKEELANSKKVVKKHIENQVKGLESKSELNEVEKKKLKTLKERLTKLK
ncbi:hypothetical protein FACS1894161_0850 [Spirochaetia bacterium]|nr:hypothetical protein FACS1894161_0850 [Spirochaetia bacterium]